MCVIEAVSNRDLIIYIYITISSQYNDTNLITFPQIWNEYNKKWSRSSATHRHRQRRLLLLHFPRLPRRLSSTLGCRLVYSLYTESPWPYSFLRFYVVCWLTSSSVRCCCCSLYFFSFERFLRTHFLDFFIKTPRNGTQNFFLYEKVLFCYWFICLVFTLY